VSRLDSARNGALRVFLSWTFLIVVGLILGGFVASYNLFIGKPDIGVIRVSGIMLAQKFPGATGLLSGGEIIEMLRYARDNQNIRAVVVEIDSPGGEASVVEEIFMELLELRKLKPVVASIDSSAASGGYYIAAAANFIYCKPDSEVGSIGAWSILPQPQEISEDFIPTGPFKTSGGSRQKAVVQLEMVKESFLRAVVSQRGEKLTVSPVELSRAEVYIGIEALRLGLVDELGTGTEAREEAARLAGISHHGVVDINQAVFPPTEEQEPDIPLPPGVSVGLDALKSTVDKLPKFYYLYVEPE